MSNGVYDKVDCGLPVRGADGKGASQPTQKHQLNLGRNIMKSMLVSTMVIVFPALLTSCSGNRIGYEGNVVGHEKTFEISVDGRDSASQSVAIDFGGQFEEELCTVTIRNMGPGSLVTSVTSYEGDKVAARMEKLDELGSMIVYDGPVKRMGFALGDMGKKARKIQVRLNMKNEKEIAGKIRARVLWADGP